MEILLSGTREVLMAISKNTRPTHEPGTGTLGLLAIGSSGQWEIAIDETTSGPARWFAQLDGPSVSFHFEIASVAVVGKLIRFLEPRPSANSSKRNGLLVIGQAGNAVITLIKDDEYPNRFFLIVGPIEGPIVRFVIAEPDAAQIADALRQVEEDLGADE